MENEIREEAQPEVTGNSREEGAPETRKAVDAGIGVATEDLQTHGNIRNASSFDMPGMLGSLPSYSQGGPPHLYPHQIRPVANQTPMYPYAAGQYTTGLPSFAVPFAQQMPMHYQGQRLPAAFQGDISSGQHPFPNQMYVPAQMMMPGPAQPHYQQLHQGSMFAQSQRPQHLRGPPAQQQFGYRPGFPEQLQSAMDIRGAQYPAQTAGNLPPSTIRGPPRKPKQSGHALWVGNLPPGANIIDLKDHFSRDASDEIESVFLISKSNCAFVNYKTEQSCTAAMTRFHDSRFQGVRLVCRLRRGSVPGAPTTSSSPTIEPSTGAVAEEGTVSATLPTVEPSTEVTVIDDESRTRPQSQRFKERFFVIKSLTIEDLARSVHSGVWATQSHNEAALNEAYKSADNVYLIFSANKSGQYFGYARMDSPIDDESAASIVNESPGPEHRFLAESQASSPAILPLTIPTAATATAPKGHIIDDSARGTIFWEADQEEEVTDEGAETASHDAEEGSTVQENVRSPMSAPVDLADATNPAQATYGKPFKITWQSTDRLPFYRTRGLRNPWNTNREVKIARDGTEIEPSVGRRLVDMFGTPAPAQHRSQGGYGNPAMEGSGMMSGYQPSGYGGGH